MKFLRVETAVNGESAFSIQQSDSVIVYDMVADTNLTLTVPEKATKAIYQFYGSDLLYVRHGGAAFVSVPSSSDSVLNELMVNPDVRTIEDDQTEIHLISGVSGRLIVSYYGG